MKRNAKLKSARRVMTLATLVASVWQSLFMPITTVYAASLENESSQSLEALENTIKIEEIKDYTLDDDELWLEDVYSFENMDGYTTFRANGYVKELKRISNSSYDLTHLVKGWKTVKGIPRLQGTLGGINYDLFCIEPGVIHESNGEMSTQSYYNQLTDEQKNKLNIILMYGFRNNGDTSDDSYIATQVAVWEVVVKEPHYGGVWWQLVRGNTNREAIYTKLMQDIDSHDVTTSFSGQEHELKWNGKEYAATLTDTNNVLGKYEVVGVESYAQQTSSPIMLLEDNNQLHFTSKIPNLKQTVELIKEAKYGGQTMFWTGTKQNLISGGQSTPVRSMFTLKSAPLGSLTIEKKGPNGEAIENVEFRVEGPSYNQTHRTDASGLIVIPNVAGGTYTITEVSVPSPYLIDTTPKTITINQGDSGKVQFVNESAKGKIEIYKTGEQLESVKKVEGGYTFNYTQQPLKDTTFDVYAKEDIRRPDGTLVYTKDELVKRLVTGADGKASASDLPLGNYYIKEVQAPNGLVVSTEIHDVSLTYQNASTSIVTTSKSFENFRQKVNVSLTKVGEQKKGGFVPLKDVSFGIYTKDDILINGQIVIPKGSLVHTLVTKEDGTSRDSIALPVGSYYVQEIKAPEGYVVSDEKFDFEFTGTAQQALSVDVNVNKGNVITNMLARGGIRLLKDSPTDVPLEGAVFDLYTKDGVLVGTYTTDKNGYIEVSNLIYDEYYLVEQKAPNGYRLSDEVVEFAIRKNGEILDLEVVNQPTRVEVTKYDPENNKLEGAKMQIVDMNGNVVTEWITTKETKVIEGLKHGKYILREVVAPDTYQKILDIEFEVTDANRIIELACIDDPIRIEITKEDKLGNLLSGAKLQLLDMNEKVIEEWTTESEPKVLTGLPHGEYILREVEAPTEFVKAEDIVITVTDENGTQKVTMVDDWTTVEVHKVDEAGNPLAGAVLQLINEENEVLDEWMTDGNARVFEGLPHGKYTIKEIQQPLGYQKRSDLEFEVTDELSVVKVGVINVLTKTEITKYDDKGNKLFGATMQIIDSEGNVVVEWETTDETKLIEGLIPGDYILREITAPDTFKKILDVPFTVTDEEKVHILEVTDEPTSTTIHKVDEDGKYILGAVLQLIDSEGNVVTEWETNKKPEVIKGLKHGDYILREVRAPRGYLKADDIKFAVTDSQEDLDITMVDEFDPNVAPLPVTGMGIVAIVLALGGTTLGAYGVYDIMKKRQNR